MLPENNIEFWFIAQVASVHNLLIFVVIEREGSFMHSVFCKGWTAGRGVYFTKQNLVTYTCMSWFIYYVFNSSFQYTSWGSYIINLLSFSD